VSLLSMTGFGEVHDDRDSYAISVEVRTVNSRYLKIHLRTTDGYGTLESRLEAVIREYVKRGTIHCNVRIRHLGAADDFRLNTEVLNQYVDQLQEVAAKRDLSEDIRLESLAGLPGVVEELSTAAHDAAHVWPLVEPILRSSLEDLSKMRAAEGKALAVDLNEQSRWKLPCRLSKSEPPSWFSTIENGLKIASTKHCRRLKLRLNRPT